ncbi:MAG: tyrosine-type recombinase/integrase [Cellvibrionaceae bacterium]|nr:tyrosine-type recombinase/integrase [Cellvibrionaceae bacterium]
MKPQLPAVSTPKPSWREIRRQWKPRGMSTNPAFFQNAAAEWIEHHCKINRLKPKTVAMYKAAIQKLTTAFYGRDISTIQHAELLRLLDVIQAKRVAGAVANHTATTTRLLFRWARGRLGLAQDPTEGLRNPARIRRRDRTLTRDEIRVLWRACDAAGYPWGHALRLQMLTGQRIGEIGAIRRSDVDGDFWIMSRNKTEKRIDIFLTKTAKAILAECPNFGAGAAYFSASAGSSGLRSDVFNNALKRHIRPRLEAAALELGLDPIAQHWTPHDIRRSVRSGLTGWAGVFPDVAERTLNHALSGIRSNYDFADYLGHVADALRKWEGELLRILAGEAPVVVPFNREVVL